MKPRRRTRGGLRREARPPPARNLSATLDGTNTCLQARGLLRGSRGRLTALGTVPGTCACCFTAAGRRPSRRNAIFPVCKCLCESRASRRSGVGRAVPRLRCGGRAEDPPLGAGSGRRSAPPAAGRAHQLAHPRFAQRHRARSPVPREAIPRKKQARFPRNIKLTQGIWKRNSRCLKAFPWTASCLLGKSLH